MPEQIKVRLNYLADLLDLEQAARLGDILPPESARVIEKALHLNKIDLVNRARLLGFYKWRTQNRRAKNYKLFEENSIKHILWFIKNVPGCAFCSDDYFALKSSASPYYKKVANAWRTAIRENADDNQVALNAALFFIDHEPSIAETLSERVLEVDQKNEWARAILHELNPSSNSFSYDTYELDELASLPAGKAIRNLLKSRESTFINNSFRCKISAPSAATLLRVLEKHPSDVNARAGLVAYYGSRCQQKNRFGINPEFERKFVSHLAWFIKFALHAEGLDEVRIPELSAKGKRTLLALLKLQKSANLNKSELKNKRSLLERLKIEKDPSKKSNSHYRRKPNKPEIIDAIALPCDQPKLSEYNFSEKYTVTEWSNDSYLREGGLTGSYKWFAKDFEFRLDEALQDDALDLYHRALIIECYKSNGKQRKANHSKLVFEKHVLWFIKQCPGSSYLRSFWWDGMEETDFELKTKLNKAWLKASKSSHDPNILINASLAHFGNDKRTAKRLIDKARKISPNNSLAAALSDALTKKSLLFGPEARLKQLKFEPGRASKRLTKYSNVFNTATSELFGVYLPKRSTWTQNQVLRNNANDFGLRSELMGTLHNYEYLNAIESSTPDTASADLSNELWWIQNVPAMTTFRLFTGAQSGGLETMSAVAAAWIKQIDRYPAEVQVAINASRVFFGHNDLYQQGIDVLKKALKLHPENSKLKEKLQRLREFKERFDEPFELDK